MFKNIQYKIWKKKNVTPGFETLEAVEFEKDGSRKRIPIFLEVIKYNRIVK